MGNIFQYWMPEFFHKGCEITFYDGTKFLGYYNAQICKTAMRNFRWHIIEQEGSSILTGIISLLP